MTIEEYQKEVDKRRGKKDLKILEYTGANYQIKAKCLTCGTIFTKSISSYVYNHVGCPICQTKQTNLGRTIKDKMPHLYEYLINKSDMDLHCGSPKRIKLKCPTCLNEFEKPIREIYRKGLSCPRCGSNRSFPNRICDAFLTILNVEFKPEKIFKWSNYIYDFYIPKYEMIIEMQGGQHFKKVSKFSGTSLKKRKEMDLEKEKLALLNGIKIYDKIDAIEQDFDYIFDNIKISKISKLMDVTKISKNEVHYKSMINDDFIKVIELANLKYSGRKIEKLLHIPYERILDYIKFASDIGICNPRDSHGKIKIIQCDIKTGKFIREHESVEDAQNEFCTKSIGACLRKKCLTAAGFIWFYKEDYDEIKAIETATEFKNRKHGYKRSLLKYSLENKFIKKYNSLSEASKDTKVSKSDIIDCAKERTKSAGGYVWIYENK